MSGSAYGAGPESVQSASRTKGRHTRPDPSALHPYTPLYSTGHANNEGEAQTRTYPNPAPRRHGHAAQRNTNNPSDGPSQGAPTPYPRVYARSVLTHYLVYISSKRARRTSHQSNDVPIGYRSWVLHSRSFGSYLPKYSCTVRQIPADIRHHIFGG